jgi:protein-tyrosine-phosphatase
VRLLFVCTGNVCRSAAAERLLTSWNRRGQHAIEVSSAGTRARPAQPIHPGTEEALGRHGVRAGGFRSRRLSERDVDRADLVLTMTALHREEVVTVNPRGLRKVFTLKEAALLCAAIPAGRLDVATAGRRGPLFTDVLGEARSTAGRLLRVDYDIADPINGSAQLHVEVIDEISAALTAVLAVLDVPRSAEQTVRMDRLPPVPALITP